ncbi:hypothetical protein [Kitasatospora purpeofusca]|uniref:hypothetical protein n=1 Tax=Kitasatospora purpeofusca TaxID=67352 RepID=UPI003827CB33
MPCHRRGPGHARGGAREWVDIEVGAVVIDAGYNAGGVGDVDLGSARRGCGPVTPVTGGVGPVTFAVRLAQAVEVGRRGVRS